MSTARLTDAEIRALGWMALIERLGPAGALRFAMQTERGWGDYGDLRDRLLGSLSTDELLERIRTWRAGKRRSRGSRRR